MKMEVIDLDLQGHFGHFDLEFLEIWLVRAITRHRFGLESPNLHQTCILGYSQLVLKMEVIDLDLQGHFGHFDLEFLGIWLVSMISCNGFELESPKYASTMYRGILSAGIEMGGHWPWPSEVNGLAIILTEETAFNVALVYWSRPAKGCYTSQTCSCRISLISHKFQVPMS